MQNLTKIIATAGPACEDRLTLKKMLLAGLDVVRLNFSHGTYAQFEKIIATVRQIERETGHPIAILQDLQGPKIRIGEVAAAGLTVAAGDVFILKAESAVAAREDRLTIPIQYEKLADDVRRGDTLLIDDGLLECTITAVNKARREITCRAVTGGIIKTHKGINVPLAHITATPFTEHDKRDAEFGLKHGVDYVALSFVRAAEDMASLKRFIAQRGGRAKVIAKIERHEAMQDLEKIIDASDAVMVARGDLGIEIAAEQVPLVQKKIIHIANTLGKPVIVATQILNSMVASPRATRAEISDAATAIFDHADCLLLANETAVGAYPVQAVRTLAKVASAVEASLATHQHLLRPKHPEDLKLTDAICLNATKLAQDIGAQCIVAITKSGYTAREIAKYRPFVPIIVFTPDKAVARQMCLVWGVQESFVQFINLTHPLRQIRQTLLQRKLAKAGDEIVICHAGFGRKEKLITTTMV